MNHREYSTQLEALQTDEGRRVAQSFLGAVSTLVKGSEGNLDKLPVLMRMARKQMMKQGIPDIRKAGQEASRLGEEFGRGKV